MNTIITLETGYESDAIKLQRSNTSEYHRMHRKSSAIWFILVLLLIFSKSAVSAMQPRPLSPDEMNKARALIKTFRSQLPHPCSFYNEIVEVLPPYDHGRFGMQQKVNALAASGREIFINASSQPFPRYAISNYQNLETIFNTVFFTQHCPEFMDIQFSKSNIRVAIARSYNTANQKFYWGIIITKDIILNELSINENFGNKFYKGWLFSDNPIIPIGQSYRLPPRFQYNTVYQSSKPLLVAQPIPIFNAVRNTANLKPLINTENTNRIDSLNINARASGNFIKRVSTGLYQATLTNFSIPETKENPAGVLHVSAVEGNHFCKVYEQRIKGNDLQLNIACFDPDGHYINGKFSILSYKDGIKWALIGKITRYGLAYVLANLPEINKPYIPTGVHQYNSRSYQIPYHNLFFSEEFSEETGTPNTVSRISQGQYRVTFPNMQRDRRELDKGGTVLVTAYGYGALRCKAKDWKTVKTSVLVDVLCHNIHGKLTDSMFTASFMREAGTLAIRNEKDKQESYYIWGGKEPVQKHTFFQSDSYGQSLARSVEIKPGIYDIYLPDIQAKKSSNIQVSAHGSDSHYCNIDNWASVLETGETRITVACYNTEGMSVRSNFSLQYFTDQALVKR